MKDVENQLPGFVALCVSSLGFNSLRAKGSGGSRWAGRAIVAQSSLGV